MVLSIIFLEDKHNILLHLSIFYEYQQFFQHCICFSIQPPDYSDPWPRLARSSSFFLIMLFNNKRQSTPTRQSRMDIPEKLAIFVHTRRRQTKQKVQRNVCWKPLYANKQI